MSDSTDLAIIDNALTIAGRTVPLIDTDAKYDGKVIVRFSENNSGGGWWLNGDQYRALLKSGEWGLDRAGMEYAASDYQRSGGTHDFDTADVPYFLRDYIVGIFDSYADGVASWERLTGEDADTVGCECCGPPYRLYATRR